MLGLFKLELSDAQERDVLMCNTGNALNCRVVEVFLSEFLWDHDVLNQDMYQGTAAVHIFVVSRDASRDCSRQHLLRKGHLPRLGRANNIEWDLVLRLLRYAERRGLQISAECSKDERLGGIFLH